jgi:hypothetical protein
MMAQVVMWKAVLYRKEVNCPNFRVLNVGATGIILWVFRRSMMGALLRFLSGLCSAVVVGLPAWSAAAETTPSGQLQPIPWFTWQSEIVTAEATPVAFALGPADRPHVLVRNSADDRLHYGVRRDGGWSFTDVPDSMSGAAFFTLAVDAFDRPHVLFADEIPGQVFYGLLAEDQWTLEPVSTADRSPVMALDSGGRPHMALIQDGDAEYLVKGEPGWTREWIGPASSYLWLWLAIDGQDRPHVVYGGAQALLYAVRQESGEWTAVVVPHSALGFSLGPADEPYLLIVGREDLGWWPPQFIEWLSVVEWDGDEWIENGSVGSTMGWFVRAEILADRLGRLHVMYGTQDGASQYARRDEDGQWRWESTPLVFEAWHGFAVGRDNEPRLMSAAGGTTLLKRTVLWLDRFSLLPVVYR